MTFSAPILKPGMILTEVVDMVSEYFIWNCCRKPERAWFAASKPAHSTSQQEHFVEIETSPGKPHTMERRKPDGKVRLAASRSCNFKYVHAALKKRKKGNKWAYHLKRDAEYPHMLCVVIVITSDGGSDAEYPHMLYHHH